MEPRVGVQNPASSTVVAPARPPGKEGPHLPWTGSMAGPEFTLTYMPFMEHMLNVLASSFGEMTALPLADRLAFVENEDKQARMLRSVCCILTVSFFRFCFGARFSGVLQVSCSSVGGEGVVVQQCPCVCGKGETRT